MPSPEGGATGLALVAYTRQTGAGPLHQADTIHTWAAGAHHRLVATLAEEGARQEPDHLAHRPQLVEALRVLGHQDAAGLVVVALKVVSTDLVAQEVVRAAVLHHGAVLLSLDAADVAHLADEPTGEGSARRRLVRRTLVVAHELERARIGARLTAGRRARAADGGQPGPSPFGWALVDGALVAEPGEQATIARLAELHAGGLSLRAMAATLTAEGRRPRRAETWSAEAVRRMVARLDDSNRPPGRHRGATGPEPRGAAMTEPGVGR